MTDIRHRVEIDADEAAKGMRGLADAFDELGDESVKATSKAAKGVDKLVKETRDLARESRKARKEAGGIGETFTKVATGVGAALFTAEKVKMAFVAVADAVYSITETEPEIKKFSGAWNETLGTVLDPLAATVVGLKGATADWLNEFSQTQQFKDFANNARTVFFEILVPALGLGIQQTRNLFDIFGALGDEVDVVGNIFGGFKDLLKAIWSNDASAYADAKAAIADMRGNLGDLGDSVLNLGADFNWNEQQVGKYVEAVNLAARGAIGNISATRRAQEAAKDFGAEIETVAAKVVAAEDKKEQAIRRTARVRKEAAQEAVNVEQYVATTVADIAGQMATAVIGELRRLNEERTADVAERRQREIGLAILMGEIQAGLAFATTLAQIGGTPAGYAAAAAAAAAVGAATKISAAVGAAQSKHDGGEVVRHDGGVAPDEVMVRARQGEFIVSAPDVRAAGGAAGIEDRVKDRGGARSITVVQKVDHRVLDVQTSRAVRRTGSPLNAALRAANPRPTARRLPYAARN